MKIRRALPIAASFIALAATAQTQTYDGNGATGLGGEIGNGSLTMSDSLSGMYITLNPGAGGLNFDCVLYLDTQSDGFPDTSQFFDNAGGAQEAISGYNGGNPSQTVATFPTGFGADYAISIENSSIGVYGLAAGGNGSLTLLFSQSQSGNPGPFSLSLTPLEMSQIGLTVGSGQTFSFVGSLINDSAYRSDETFGPSVTTPGNPIYAPNAGFTGSQVFTGDFSYTLGAVPEPGTATLLGLGLAHLGWLWGRTVRKPISSLLKFGA